MTATLTREELYRLVWAKPRTAVAQELGVSASGLGRLCDRLMIPYPSRDYWAKARTGRGGAIPALPAGPRDIPDRILISPTRGNRSRRSQSWLPRGERRSQILDKAAEMIEQHGLAGVTLKGVAMEMGLSEASIYTYFSSPAGLFAELAKRELATLEERTRPAVETATDEAQRTYAMIVEALKLTAERRGLLQVLMGDPAVAKLASGEAAPATGDDPLAIEAEITAAVAQRCAAALGRGQVDLDTAEKLCLAAQLGGAAERGRRYRALKAG